MAKITQSELTQQNTKDIAVIKNDISTIKNNHLKHIEADVNKIDKRLWMIIIIALGTLGTTLMGVITNALS